MVYMWNLLQDKAAKEHERKIEWSIWNACRARIAVDSTDTLISTQIYDYTWDRSIHTE